MGRINSPSYRVIVAEHARGPKTGNFLEVLGTYDPKTKARTLNADRIKYWISVGAQPSDTMHNMLISAGITSGKKINVLPTMVVAPAPVEAPAAPATSNVAETEKAETTSNEVEPETAVSEVEAASDAVAVVSE